MIKRNKIILSGVILTVVSMNIITIGTLVERVKLLNQEVIQTRGEITNLENIAFKLEEERDVLVESNLSLIDELENIKKEYSELDKLYKNEIKPVKFNPSNLLSPSDATTNKLRKALKGTGLEGMEGAYLKAEEEYGVNAIFVIALTAEESAWGNSHRAKTQNNMSGYAVYSRGSKGRYFNSKEESILETAKLLSEEYLNSAGNYYNGLSASSVNIRYCPNDGGAWSNNITKISNQLVDKINSL